MLITNVVNEGRIIGMKLARIALMVSHMLFADDSMIFIKAIKDDVDIVTEILELYAKMIELKSR